MSKNLLRALTTAWVAVIATAASAGAQDELSKGDKEWMENEVSAIITQEEVDIFQSIHKDDRRLFKELFWLRRDFNPGTEDNEYRDGYEKRIKVANDAFKTRGRKGYETEMGQVFLLMGSPDEQQRGGVADESGLPEIPAAPESDREDQAPTRMPGSAGGAASEDTMLWVYNPNEPLGIPDGLAIEFRQREQFGFRMANRDTIEPHLARVKERMIVDRRITYARNEEGRLLSADELSPGKVLLAELRSSGVTSSAIAFTATPSYFMAGDGRIYIPIDYTISEGPTSGELMFFQTVVDADGSPGEMVERAETLTQDDSGQWRYEFPLQLEPGAYKLYTGFLDASSQASGTQIIDLDVPELEGDALKLSSIVMFRAAEPRGQTQESPFIAQAPQMALATFDIPLDIPNFSEDGEYKIVVKVIDHVKNETLEEELAIIVE